MRKFITSLILVLGLSLPLLAQPKPYKIKPIKFASRAQKAKGIRVDLANIETFFSLIPPGQYRRDKGEVQTTQSFYMMKVEVPNMLYRLFIADLQNQGRVDEVKVSLPDSNAWGTNNLAYVDYYYSHPAYSEYPVIQVPRQGVLLFCAWLAEKVKTIQLKDWKNKKIEFRLPTEHEWMVAASGGDTNAIFSWKGPYMTMGSGPWNGDFMANFRRTDNGSIIRDENGKLTVRKYTSNTRWDYYFQMNNTADITAPVLNYWPNAYGLFCMTGNVREMVQEEGFTKGGSWFDPGGECTIEFRNTYHKEGYPCEGFRIIAVVTE